MKRWLNLPTRKRTAPDDGLPEPTRRKKHPAPTLAERDLRTAWQLVSLLLDYPSEERAGQWPMLQQAAAALPDPVGQPLVALLDQLRGADLGVLQRDYVETFDTSRKCALHLTYYAHGDTRKRGIALVQFKQAFRRAGMLVTEDELPDHLGVVLEFGATADLATAWRLVNDHRAGVELLQLGLDARHSPWAGAVAALRATLPALDGDQSDAVARLLAEGPPNEDVGLDTYAIDPRLNPHPDDDLLAASVGGPIHPGAPS